MPKVSVYIYINGALWWTQRARKEKLSDFKVYSDAVPPFKQQIYTW